MTYKEAVAELRARFPKADVSVGAMHGEYVRRAETVTFAKHKGGVYAGKDRDGTEVLVYFNDTANLICCTEIEADKGTDD
jgi:hypothetical protein